jgi:transcriptional regulator with XRE-family HTH domain
MTTALSVLVGKRIREIRESKNIKQVELAEMIDVEATNLSKLEKGVHLPKEDNIRKITTALGVEVKELFDFGHLQSRDELLNNIQEILQNATNKEIQFFYKILMSYKELK